MEQAWETLNKLDNPITFSQAYEYLVHCPWMPYEDNGQFYYLYS